MRLPPALCLAALAAAVLPTGGAEPASSRSCREALAALDHEEALLAARRPDDVAASTPRLPPELQRLRQRAARACLGTEGAPAQPLHVPPPPVSLSPPAPVQPPSARHPAPPALPGPSPLPVPRPPISATVCDAAGCWASDGTRLQRLGPSLVGPGKVCSETGGLLQCR